MLTLLIVGSCIALNAALAAVEVAFIAASRANIQTRTRDGRVARFLRLRQSPERTLSTIQVGITLVSLVSGAAGGAWAQEFVTPFLEGRLALPPGAARALAIGAVAVPLMFGTVVVGELVPKVWALRHAEQVALAGARWLHVLERALLPVVGILAWATKALLPREPPPGPDADGRAGTRPARRHYALDLHDLAQRRVRDAMIPWSRAVVADASLSPHALADLAHACGHTRLPVVRDGAAAGLLHTKELMAFLAAGQQDWRTLVRPITVVGPDDSLLGVLQLLQRRRTHLAVVSTHQADTLGIVTLEDILEEVLGDLYDEDDDRAVEQLLAARGRLRKR